MICRVRSPGSAGAGMRPECNTRAGSETARLRGRGYAVASTLDLEVFVVNGQPMRRDHLVALADALDEHCPRLCPPSVNEYVCGLVLRLGIDPLANLRRIIEIGVRPAAGPDCLREVASAMLEIVDELERRADAETDAAERELYEREEVWV